MAVVLSVCGAPQTCLIEEGILSDTRTDIARLHLSANNNQNEFSDLGTLMLF